MATIEQIQNFMKVKYEELEYAKLHKLKTLERVVKQAIERSEHFFELKQVDKQLRLF